MGRFWRLILGQWSPLKWERRDRLDNVKKLVALRKDASHIASFLQMVLPLMALGIYKSLFSCGGNNGIARVIAITIDVVSVAFSALNLAMHFHGWHSFFSLLCSNLKCDKRPFYDYTGLWNIYGLLFTNSWFWSSVALTKNIDYSSAVSLHGYSHILAIIRSFNLRDDAGRVMVAGPLIAFTTTHILYLNNFKIDNGIIITLCLQILMEYESACCHGYCTTTHLVNLGWRRLASFSKEVVIVVAGGGLAMLLEMFEFPPYQGLVDAHGLWHTSTIPLTCIWWRFIKDDAEYRTSNLLKKGLRAVNARLWLYIPLLVKSSAFSDSASELVFFFSVCLAILCK
ncbi:hypothetical protein Pfo_022994 [Paulownia fortunei]|nr:hypothetical protein Pfo_022994 [Paulownia fortunei]